MSRTSKKSQGSKIISLGFFFIVGIKPALTVMSAINAIAMMSMAKRTNTNQMEVIMRQSPFRQKLCLTVFVALLVVFTGTYCSAAMETININTASVEELIQLDRIGAKYAARIVEYRETEGRFEKPEDIMNVKGIGQKTWEANKDRIVL